MPENTGAMIAFFLPTDTAERLAAIASTINGTPTAAADMHLTLVHLGDAASVSVDREMLREKLEVFARCHPAIIGSLNGFGRFSNSDPNAIYANFDSPELPEFRQCLIECLTECGLQFDPEHGFTPHITLAYIPADAPMPDLGIGPTSLAFQELMLAWGDERYAFPLSSPFVQIEGESMPTSTPTLITFAEAGMAEAELCESTPVEVEAEGEQAVVVNVTISTNVESSKAAPETVLEHVKTAVLEAPAYTEIELDGPLIDYGAIKMMDTDGERIGGYLVVFGDSEHRDTTGEWFTKTTDLGIDWLPKRPALYHHGLDNTVKATLIGTIDSLKIDDIGVWAEAQLSKANRYYEAIKKLISKGALKWSSGTLPHLIIKAASGEILKWPIIEGSVTPTPAEPRKTDVMLLPSRHYADQKAITSAMKALNLPTAQLLLEEAMSGENTAGDSGADGSVKSMSVGEFKQVLTDTLSEVLDAAKAAKDTTTEAEGESKTIADQPQDGSISSVDQPSTEENPTPEEATNMGQETEVKTLPANGSTKSADLPIPGVDNQETRIQITRATKYSDMSAQDMSYMANMLSGITSLEWSPSVEFQREYVDKASKSIKSGELPSDSLDKIVDKQGYIKSNELGAVGQSNYGAEWVQDGWRSELWKKVRQDNVVAPLFPMIEMPNSPWELPFESGDPTVYYVGETTDITQLVANASNPTTASKVGTGKIQMNAKKMALRIAWSSELNEDSLIPIIANYRAQAVRAMQNAIDNVILNGDTVTSLNNNVNLYDGTPTAGTKYLAFDGLRKYSVISNTAQIKDAGGAAPTLALLRQTRFKMAGAYATKPRECAWIVDDQTYAALLNMPEFLTMDKAGPAATNLTGQLGVIDGVPVFPTAELGLTAATGKTSGTGSNNTLGNAIIVFRPNFMVGYRRQVQANVEFFSWADAYHMIVSVRLCMVNFDTTSAAQLINIAV